jgi:uncharacterized membrane protein
MLTIVNQIVALPVFSIHVATQARVSRFIHRAFLFVAILNTSTCIPLAVTAHYGDVNFNRAMYVYGLCQGATVVIIVIMMIHYARALRFQVNKHNLNDAQLDKKLDSFIKGSFSFVVGQIPGLTSTILMWTLGSSPFFWVVMFLIFFCTPVSLVTSTVGLFNVAHASRNSKRINSKNVNQIMQHTGIAPADDAGSSSDGPRAATPASPSHHPLSSSSTS